MKSNDLIDNIFNISVKVLQCSMIDELRKLNKAILNFYNCYKFVVNIEQIFLLLKLYNIEKCEDCLSITQISSKIDMERSTLSRNFSRLRKMGFVEEIFDKADKRSRKNILTNLGKEFIEENLQTLLEMTNEIIGIIGEDRIEKFLLESKEISHLINKTMKQEHEIGEDVKFFGTATVKT